jgi:RND family efflux transporter MFP subunit
MRKVGVARGDRDGGSAGGLRGRARLLALLLAGALGLAGCDEAPEDGAQAEPRAVRTSLVGAGAGAEARSFPGVLTAAETIQLSFPIAGRLIAAPLNEGDAVAAGQVVARLDPADIEREIAAAKARVAAATARLGVVDGEYRRQKTLFDKGLVARAAFDRVSAELATARSELRLAETELATAEYRLGRTELAAPRPGVVTERLANRFEEVAVGAPVYALAVTEALQAEVLVPEQMLGAVAAGVAAEVRLPAFPGEAVPATVTEIAAEAEAGAAFRVKVRLEDPPEGAKTGFSAAVTFALPRHLDRLAVPLSALRHAGTSSPPTAGDRASVFVHDAQTSTIALREVRIDGVAGNDVLVSEGLSPGERIVTAGVALLEEGERVRLWTPPE